MHNLNEWTNREGDPIGASIFLTAEEVKEARKDGEIKIEIRK